MPLSNSSSNSLALEETLLQASTKFEAAYEDVFKRGLEQGEYVKYTKMETGDSIQLMLLIIANHPTMRKWLGARVEKYLRSYQQTIVLERYEATLPIDRMLASYQNNFKSISSAIDTFLSGTSTAYDEASSAMLDGNSGVSSTGFDGVALFSSSHPHGPSGAVQANLAAGTNLSFAAFDAGRAAMSGWKFENGQPARRRATHMRVGPALETRAKEILSATQRVVAVANDGLEAGTRVAATTIDNVWKGELELIVDPRIPSSGTGAFYWDLFDLSGPERPVIGYVGREPEPIHQIDMSDPQRFQLDKLIYGLEGDFTFQPGHWMTCYRGTGTA